MSANLSVKMNKTQQQENFSKEKRIDHRVVTRVVLIFTSVVIFFLIFTILLVESSYYNVASEDEYELKSVHLVSSFNLLENFMRI